MAEDYDAGRSRKALPPLREDMRAGQREDSRLMKRGRDPKSESMARRVQQRDIGSKAAMRTAGRAGLPGAALAAGMGLGSMIDKATGASGKIADALMSGKDARVAEMLKGSGPRPAEAVRPRGESVPAPRAARPAPSPTPTVREGANANIGDDVRERARRYVAAIAPEAEPAPEDSYAEGGPVKRGRGDGIAQRGLTKGKFI